MSTAERIHHLSVDMKRHVGKKVRCVFPNARFNRKESFTGTLLGAYDKYALFQDGKGRRHTVMYVDAIMKHVTFKL